MRRGRVLFRDRRANLLRNQATLFLAYLQTMENFLEAEIQKFLEERERIETELQACQPDITPDDIDIWEPAETLPEIEELLNEIRIIEEFELTLVEEFGDLLRKSLFVGLYGFLESALVEECYHRRGSEAPDAMSRVKGSTVKKAAACLGYSLGESPKWEEIENYRKLRNCIVHGDSALTRLRSPQDRVNLEKYVAGEKGLSLSPKGFVIFEKGFCENAVETVERFLFSVAFGKEKHAAA